MQKKGKIDVDEFWTRLDHARDIADVSIIDLQTMIGMEGTYLYTAKCHKTIPSTYLLSKIADVLGVSVDYLIGRSTKMTDDPVLDKFIQLWNDDAHGPILRQLVLPAMKIVDPTCSDLIKQERGV